MYFISADGKSEMGFLNAADVDFCLFWGFGFCCFLFVCFEKLFVSFVAPILRSNARREVFDDR